MSIANIAAVIGAYKAGQIGEQVAKRTLRELGVDDETALSLLGIGAGIVTGLIVGDMISDAVGEIFDMF